jgi:hypothetical protein
MEESEREWERVNERLLLSLPPRGQRGPVSGIRWLGGGHALSAVGHCRPIDLN